MKQFTILLFIWCCVIALSTGVTSEANPLCGEGLDDFWTPKGLCAWVWASGFNNPRGILLDADNNFLVVENGRVTGMFDSNSNGKIESNETWIVTPSVSLNHGIALNSNYLYASTASTVYRWSYTPRTNLGTPTIVINSIPTGGHSSRTLIFDSNNVLYLSIGSGSNVDTNSNRARVSQCGVIDQIPDGGYSYTSVCSAWADGCRNEVGLRFDDKGTLWGVENGVDNLVRTDFGDIHETNPAEELNKFSKQGFYGYPYCWSEYYLQSSLSPTTQWAHPDFINDGTHTDQWCKNETNVIKPAYALPAHTAPLDLIFHTSPTFPAAFQTGLFVSLHGSWDSTIPVGYQVVNVQFENSVPVNHTRILGTSSAINDQWEHRPVALTKISPCGQLKECLLVSSDATGKIIAVGASNSTTNNEKTSNSLRISHSIYVLLLTTVFFVILML
eukprot:TRINITY_DN5671_c0_g1_i1.p1 TRINITY_DN5671_c0_g1~~TRINITY_DN5671_c0_g1_i1.p1  ORF type:complete len:444 (-),score=81.56 TRINITY_DN5671_c0_g1_i1:48-1379(-)